MERISKGRGTILIIGNEVSTNELIRRRLQGDGYICFECQDIYQAEGWLNRGDVDVILLDYGLPGSDVTRFLTETRRKHENLIVIIITDIIESENAIKLLDQGAYDYVIKPFGIDEMVYNVQRAVEKKRLEEEIKAYQQLCVKKTEDQDKQSQENFFRTIATLSFALEGKDSYTAGHSRRVSDLALAIGRKMGLSESELEDLRWGSLLHDLGKVAVDFNIVNKNGKLTSEEYASVMAHPIVGATMVVSAVKNRRISQIIEYHHLFFDGTGINQSIEGKDIPLLARIVTLADAYDAMTSDRSYRSALSPAEAVNEIKKESGVRFDPEIVKVFLQLSPDEMTPGKKTILVADDEECIRLLIRSVLGNEYIILEASNGQEAIDIAKNAHPSLILMDIFMPGKNGFDACCELRNNSDTQNIPIIILTAHDKELNRKLSSKVGADRYITKPFNVVDLLDTVKSILVKNEKPLPVYSRQV